MGAQLPPGVTSVVAAVLFFSFVNLFAVLIVIWLTWGHNERLTCNAHPCCLMAPWLST